MKQFTDPEKQQLEAKIKAHKERQQALRENNPDLPKSFEAASSKRFLGRRFAPKHLWKYGLLGLILCLLAYNVFQFFRWGDFGSNRLLNLNILIALMLLFNHIGFNITKTGQKSRVMKIIACASIAIVCVYIFLSWVA